MITKSQIPLQARLQARTHAHGQMCIHTLHILACMYAQTCADADTQAHTHRQGVYASSCTCTGMRKWTHTHTYAQKQTKQTQNTCRTVNVIWCILLSLCYGSLLIRAPLSNNGRLWIWVGSIQCLLCLIVFATLKGRSTHLRAAVLAAWWLRLLGCVCTA